MRATAILSLILFALGSSSHVSAKVRKGTKRKKRLAGINQVQPKTSIHRSRRLGPAQRLPRKQKTSAVSKLGESSKK